MFMCFLLVKYFAVYLGKWLEAGRICSCFANSLPRGVFQTITPSYAAEVVPMELRPYLTCYVNLCWVCVLLLGSMRLN